ncbi:MAG: tetratricopeptide repeat protein, partial [Kiritimatiellae bacterium]|nr:tetratricopeptide repeat protein [Kiritimatiellia bacterium]
RDFARRHYADAVTISEKRFGPNHPATEEVLYNLGMLLLGEGNVTAADGVLRRVLTSRIKRYGARNMRVAEILKPLIHVYKAQGIYDGLDAIGQRVLEIEMANMPLDDPRMIDTHTDLGDIYFNTDRASLAEPHYRRVLILREQHEGPDYYPEQESYTNFAQITVSGQQLDSVLLTWNRAIGKDRVTRITDLNHMGKVLSQQGKQADALPFYERALAISERAYGPDHHATAMAVKNVAETHYALGETEQARPHYERVADLCDRARQKDDAALKEYLDVLSQIYFMEQRYEEAAETYAKIVELERKTLGDDHPAVASALNNLAEVERLQGRLDTAEAHYLEALGIYDRMEDSPGETGGLRAVLGNLARLYEQTDRRREARSCRDRIEALSSADSSPATIVLP